MLQTSYYKNPLCPFIDTDLTKFITSLLLQYTYRSLFQAIIQHFGNFTFLQLDKKIDTTQISVQQTQLQQAAI